MTAVVLEVPVDVAAVHMAELMGDRRRLLGRAEQFVDDDALGLGVDVTEGALPGVGLAAGNGGLLVGVPGGGDPGTEPLEGARGGLPADGTDRRIWEGVPSVWLMLNTGTD